MIIVYGANCMDKKEKAYGWLKENGVEYEIAEHEAVYTIEEMDRLGLKGKGCVCKNLFLRDAKGKRHFLVSFCGDKTADLKSLGELLGGVRLSFASEERLQKYLNLTKGSVTPLGVMYDTDSAIEVVLDADLEKENRIGVHPCENNATVFMDFADLERIISSNGNKVTVVRI